MEPHAAPRGPNRGLNLEAGNEEQHHNLPAVFLRPGNQWREGNRPLGRDLRDHDRQGITRICIWGEQNAPSVFWGRLTDICRGSTVLNKVVKAARVQQTNRSTRYDVYIPQEYAQALIGKLERGVRYNWYVREHIPYLERVGRGARGVGQAPGGPGRNGLHQGQHGPSPQLKVGTYNINSLCSKRQELRSLVAEVQWDVFGVQETLLSAADWQLHIPGYSCLTVMGERTASKRGLVVAVSNKYSCTTVGRASPYWLFVRVYGATLRQPFIFGTVYVPNRLERRRVLDALPLYIDSLHEEFPNDALILTGDFNMELHELQQAITTWPVRPTVLPNEGNVPTRYGPNGRAIDHICYFGDTGGPIPRSKVLQTWDYSDHFPVEADLSGLSGPDNGGEEMIDPAVPPRRPKIVVKTNVQKLSIAGSNYWAVLENEFDECIDDTDEQSPEDVAQTMNALGERFRDTCHSIANESGLYAKEPTGDRRFRASGSVVRAVNRHRAAFVALERAKRDGSLQVPQLTIAYEEAKKRARKLMKGRAKAEWTKKVHLAHDNMCRKPREFWQWVAPTAGWRRKYSPQGIQPIYGTGENRELLTNFEEILEAWSEHYRALGADVTGNSQDESHWDFINDGPQAPEIEGLNDEFDRDDIWTALEGMKNYKASGEDGVPTEFLKACLNEQPTPDPEQANPPTHMTDCMTKMSNFAFKHGMVAALWAISEVVSIPKKGDLADMNNYRGIALMSTALKVVAVILAKRLNQALEESEFFSPSQAGFRQLEECVTQAACVVEACQRRRIAGKSTFLTFIDFKKAYDTVPHAALFAKLSRAGVRGKFLNFIKGLYTENAIRVRVGSGKSARLSPLAPLLRGLRQG